MIDDDELGERFEGDLERIGLAGALMSFSLLFCLLVGLAIIDISDKIKVN